MTAKCNGQIGKTEPELVNQFGWCEWGTNFVDRKWNVPLNMTCLKHE